MYLKASVHGSCVIGIASASLQSRKKPIIVYLVLAGLIGLYELGLNFVARANACLVLEKKIASRANELQRIYIRLRFLGLFEKRFESQSGYLLEYVCICAPYDVLLRTAFRKRAQRISSLSSSLLASMRNACRPTAVCRLCLRLRIASLPNCRFHSTAEWKCTVRVFVARAKG